MDQLLHPGGTRIQANLLPARQCSYDLCDWAVGPFRKKLDAPQTIWRNDPRLHLQAPAARVVVSADWRHSVSEDEQDPEHEKDADLHLAS